MGLVNFVADLPHCPEPAPLARSPGHMGQHFPSGIRHRHGHAHHPPGRDIVDVIADKHGLCEGNSPFTADPCDGLGFVGKAVKTGNPDLICPFFHHGVLFRGEND